MAQPRAGPMVIAGMALRWKRLRARAMARITGSPRSISEQVAER